MRTELHSESSTSESGYKFSLKTYISAEEPDGLWNIDFLDFKSIKSIIHGFKMDLDLQIKTPCILDGFGFTKEIHEIHEIHEFRSTILIIRNNDKLIIYYTIFVCIFWISSPWVMIRRSSLGVDVPFTKYEYCDIIDFMDLMDLISAFHMDLEWIWIYELVDNGLWIGFG